MGLKELRRAKGITGSQLAKELSVSERSIRRWEKDMSEVRFKHVVKMAEVLGVQLENLNKPTI